MPSRWDAILFLSGANLVIIQFSVLRNLSSVLAGSELILLVITLAYFSGFSLGYSVSHRLTDRDLKLFAAAQWLTHLTLPFSLRWVGSALWWYEERILWASPLIFFLGSFWFSSFYSVLLPRSLARGDGGGFARSYGAEVLGAAAGMAAIFAASRLHPSALMLLYQVILAAVLALLFRSKRLLLAGAAACVLYGASYARLDESSLKGLLLAKRGIRVARVLAAVDTPYQRAEVVETDDGSRQLYLDGIRHYGSLSLSRFNYFIAGLPASLLRPKEAVIVGSGSFEAVRQALPHAGRVTSVELDAEVATAGEAFLSKPPAPQERSRWTIVIDDAKHYLGNLDHPVDLVALDIAGPFQRQVAFLYTREFLRVARSRLRPGGAVSVCLSGDLASRSRTARRIAATLMAEFEDVFAVSTGRADAGFAMAGDGLRLAKPDIERALLAAGIRGARVLDRAEIAGLLGDAPEISLRRMDIVVSHDLASLNTAASHGRR